MVAMTETACLTESPKPICPAHDVRLALAIEKTLVRESRPEARHVGVVVWEGAVLLTGKVASEEARARLRAAIAAMPGVVNLRDRLTVKAS